MNNLFVDTSGWASLFIRDQNHHTQADHYFRLAIQEKQNIYTSNYIIAELVALLNSPLRIHRSQIFKIIDAIKNAPYIEIIYIDEAIDLLAWELCKNRPDKDWSLVDCSSFLIMQKLKIDNSLTTDHHFEQAGFIRLLK